MGKVRIGPAKTNPFCLQVSLLQNGNACVHLQSHVILVFFRFFFFQTKTEPLYLVIHFRLKGSLKTFYEYCFKNSTPASFTIIIQRENFIWGLCFRTFRSFKKVHLVQIWNLLSIRASQYKMTFSAGSNCFAFRVVSFTDGKQKHKQITLRWNLFKATPDTSL